MDRSPIQDALARIVSGRPIPGACVMHAVVQILDDRSDPAEIAAFLTGLQCRGIDAEILGGAADAVRLSMERFEVPGESRPVLDTCGTGGDGANSVNISTAAAIVAAACGVRVVKHGNRSASGNSGSAEVLAELGVKFDAEPPVLRRCLAELGITFLFAPRFHPALKVVAPIRKLLPFRTVFNLIGPLVNPAFPEFQVLGVPDRERARLMLGALGSVMRVEPDGDQAGSVPLRAYVVTGTSGLDEVTLSGETHVLVRDGERVLEQTWHPEDFDLPRVKDNLLRVDGPADSASKIRGVLSGERGPIRDVILANAAAALKLVGRAESLREATALAAEAIDRGDAARLLDRWATVSRSD